MISLDTETTGVDLYHKAKPFFVTTYDGKYNTHWEWDVDPETRQPIVPADDLDEINDLLRGADSLILQNSKFDRAALETLVPLRAGRWDWDWGKVHDTLVTAHLLASNHLKNLTALGVVYVGTNIQPYEDRLHDAVVECRRIARRDFKHWKLAAPGTPGMPSVKAGGGKLEDKPWKNDCWLPRAIAKEKDLPAVDPDCPHSWASKDRLCAECRGHLFWVVLAEYADADSEVTYHIHEEQQREVQRRGLTKIYEVRRQVMPLAYRMENRGVTVIGANHSQLVQKYRTESQEANDICVSIARDRGFPLTLPKSGNNGQLLDFAEDPNGLDGVKITGEGGMGDQNTGGNTEKVIKYLYPQEEAPDSLIPSKPLTELNPEERKELFKLRAETGVFGKSGRMSFDAAVLKTIKHYWEKENPGGPQHVFVQNLEAKRKRDTALSYLESYQRFWTEPGLTVPGWGNGYYILHPSLNPTGTSTLRWSSSNPNEQNISKQESVCQVCGGEGEHGGTKCKPCKGSGLEFQSLRYCFGPAEGREWWSLDAKNIELRIPAYESGEEELIALFERPDEPPYYGSNHLLVFHTLHPQLWAEMEKAVGFEKVGPACKKKYASTWYQWVKNGNFAVQYGAVDKEDGTGTADRAYHIKGAQGIIKARFAKQEALNQKWIAFAERHGYVETIPDRTVDPERGYPVLCSRTEWQRIKPTVPLNYHVQSTAMWWMLKAMIRCQEYLDYLNKQRVVRAWTNEYCMIMQVHDELVFDFPRGRGPKPWLTNLPKIRTIKRLMEEGGRDIGIPTPVSVEYHTSNWSQGLTV